jgi:hypothetical protein
MAGVRTNLPAVMRRIAAVVAVGDLDAGPGVPLGEQLLDVLADQIKARAGREAGAHGPWKPNEPRYKASKGGLPVGVKSGHMLQLDQIRGRRRVERERAWMVYGLDDRAVLTLNHFDRERPGLYELDRDIEQLLDGYAAARLTARLRRLG